MFRICPVAKEDEVSRPITQTRHFWVNGRAQTHNGVTSGGYSVLYNNEPYHALSIEAMPLPFGRPSTERCTAFALVQALQICDEADFDLDDVIILHLTHRPIFRALRDGWSTKHRCRGYFHNIETKSKRRRVFLSLD